MVVAVGTWHRAERHREAVLPHQGTKHRVEVLALGELVGALGTHVGDAAPLDLPNLGGECRE